MYSVPGSVGGAIFMNAGIGKQVSQSISKYIMSVKVFDGEKIVDIEKNMCNFFYRSSIFQVKKDWVIISAVFELYPQDKSIGHRIKDKRMKWAKNQGYFTYPSAGSIFNKKYAPIMSFMKGKKIGNAIYSKNKGNWINNPGNAKFKEVMLLIRITKWLHRLLFKKIHLELEIWK